MNKLFISVLLSVISMSNLAAAIVNGTCGEKLNWELNTQDGSLIITGKGSMTSSPWYTYASYINTISLPEGLTNIASYAFKGCNNLESIDIPNTVTDIGQEAFKSCSRMYSVKLGQKIERIGHRAFEGCYSIPNIIIPNSTIEIASEAFKNCSGLKSLVIGKKIATMYANAFAGCSNLKSVTIKSNSLVNQLYDRVDNFASRIGSHVIRYTIEDGVEEIGRYAFHSCDSLKYLTIGNGVKKIKDLAFSSPSSLIYLELGENIENIGDNFHNCSKLVSITCKAITPPLIQSENTFKNYNGILYVPTGSVELYKNAIIWENFNKIYAIEYIEKINDSIMCVIVNDDNSATIKWPRIDDIALYSIKIKNKGNIVITLEFSSSGQILSGKHNMPSSISRSYGEMNGEDSNKGWSYNIDNLEPGNQYICSIEARRKDNSLILSKNISFSTKSLEAIGNVMSETKKDKRIVNGQLLIEIDNRQYNMTGVQIH